MNRQGERTANDARRKPQPGDRYQEAPDVPLGRGDGRDPWRDLMEELDDAIAYAARLNLGAEVQILRSVLLRVLARGGAR